MVMITDVVHCRYIQAMTYFDLGKSVKKYLNILSRIDSNITVDYSDKSNCAASERFGDISISHLKESRSLHAYSWGVYTQMVAELSRNGRLLSEAAQNSHSVRRYHLYQRIGSERQALAAMMMARVEQIGLTLTLHGSPFYPLQSFVRGLVDGMARLQNARLERAEDRLSRQFLKALADPKLATVVRDMLASMRDLAAPGKLLQGP